MLLGRRPQADEAIPTRLEGLPFYPAVILNELSE
jgi:hypothetical protein